MNRMLPVATFSIFAVTLLSLTGCNSISSQISRLNSESADVEGEVRIRTDHVKSIMALVATLEQVKRDGGTPKSKHDLEVARERYEKTKDKL